MTHEISVLGCGAIYIDNERVFGSKPYGLFSTVNWSATDEDLNRIADRCLELIADRKTETTTEDCSMVELSKVRAELNEWRDLIGDDVVDDIISNLEEEADEDEPQTDKWSHDCIGCGNNDTCEFAFTDAVKICRYINEPQTERSE